MPIFDQGYQHWQGPLSGHGWRWLAIAQQGVRIQSRKRLPRFLMLFAFLPAIALVGFVALWGLVEQGNETVTPLIAAILPPQIMQNPVAFRGAVWTLAYSFFFKFEMFTIMLLVVFVGPGLISLDLRFNALPLYFARPLTRLDYFLGKLGVIGALVGLVAVGPATVAYAVGVCFSFDLSVIKDTYTVLLGSVAYGLVITVSTGTLMLALSSLTRRSLYVAIAFAGFWIVSGTVASIMTSIYQESLRRGQFEEAMARWEAKNPRPPGAQADEFGGARGMAAGGDAKLAVEAARWRRERDRARRGAWMESQAAIKEELREDWRPLFGYVGNLERIGEMLLDTDTAWVAFGKALLRPPPGDAWDARADLPLDERQFADQFVPQYPWWWSAAVLAGLAGISTWTMTRRVKSLDRLK